MEEILQSAARAGITIEAAGDDLRVKAPQGALTDELRQSLRQHKNELLRLLKSGLSLEETIEPIEPDPANRHEAFVLTDLQHAYWLGRESALQMGNVATHLYVELECERLDIKHLQAALNEMILRHDMLRAVVQRNGTQRILAKVPEYSIAVNELSNARESEITEVIDKVRNELSHQVFDSHKWPLFEVRVSVLPNGLARMHVSLDLLILDAWSIFLFFREWYMFYQDPERDVDPFSISFREYVLAEQRLQKSSAYKRSQAYWLDRIEQLPPAPDLPLASDTKAGTKPKFVRREARIKKEKWFRLKQKIREEGLTSSVTLLVAYSEVLAKWSANPHFTLNVTLSNRKQLHKDVNSLLGDFTSLLMHEVDRRDVEASFLQFARRQQKLFAEEMEHREFSGVAVMREWARRRGSQMSAVMPVVFSSGLIWSGDNEVGNLEQFGKKVFSISQTSQVWLDHHVMELEGDLYFVWDAVEEKFEPGVLDAMFSAYCQLIERLAEDSKLWHETDVVVPPENMRRMLSINKAGAPSIPMALHSGFVFNALKNPDSTALISSERTLSYGELLGESMALAQELRRRQLNKGEPVAIVMRKGWEQVVAVYGVLLGGGAYMPIDADLPQQRQLDLLKVGEVRLVLTQKNHSPAQVEDAGYEIIELEEIPTCGFNLNRLSQLDADSNSLAYVIFTSGTTGVPKGVMIEHHSAFNTIAAINKMLKVGHTDRVLGLSSLSFDLSVYDIFGVMAAGGALVLPDCEKLNDPKHWRNLIQRYNVSLWNSAPQFMCMMMDSLGDREAFMNSIKTVMLSGDFIPLNLPDRLRAHSPDVKIVSLDDATEASIWSIYHEINEVDPKWKSIPYGKALPNQEVWVLNKALKPCPDYVRGKIFIGGCGVVKGYWRDEVKTRSRFLTHPQSGEKIYDTGDLGFYSPDGNIFILGREDGQVKIRGFRVELGEIESVLRRHTAISGALVVATEKPGESRQLIAYIVQSTLQGGVDEALVRGYLTELLPEYMIPRHIIFIDKIPVSSNGKVDYKALPDVSELSHGSRLSVQPRDEIEKLIQEA